jgi:Uma2 family endonuclease
MSFASFATFYAATPEPERWELIDGEAIRMPPPTQTHQRIAGNIEKRLTARLETVRPDWFADREIGVRPSNTEDYCPQPDVTVTDADVPAGQIYAPRFYIVVEVLSDERIDVIEKKRRLYEDHTSCLAYLLVSQVTTSVQLHTRGPHGWQVKVIDRPTDAVILPVIGDIGPLSAFYARTFLAVT